MVAHAAAASRMNGPRVRRRIGDHGRVSYPYPVSGRVNAECLVVLGWPRAVLMQMAHPLIAAGVARHSGFRDGPLAAVGRLRSTVRAMLRVTFGTENEAARAVAHIRDIHRRVNGRLNAPVGRFPAGTGYSAEDPDLVLWVHATLLDSVMLVYDRVVTPLSEAERDTICEEATWLAVALGARREEVPARARDLSRYLEDTGRAGTLAVGADARAIASAILRPPGDRLAGPLTWAHRLLTVGTLPAPVRELYGLRWTARDARRLAAVLRWLKRVRPVLPDVIALWPEARRARARAAMSSV